MRILCATDVPPWPERDGYRIRTANIVRSLAGVGEVDLFVVAVGQPIEPLAVPAAIRLSRTTVVPAPQRGTVAVLARWATGTSPRHLLRVDWNAPRALLLKWARPPYDLIWFEHAHTWAGLAGAVPGPTVVDLDNLEDRRLRQRHHAGRSTGGRAEGSFARRVAASLLDPIDERRWGQLQRRLANDVTAVLLCSDLDRGRLGAPNAVVVPNGYSLADKADVPTGRTSRAPVLVMISLLTYEPNVDGVWFFVDEVLPLVRAAVPSVELRLVGRHDHRVAAVADRPGVALRGEVPDVGPELRDAAVVVVPIRSGGGTRIKILEAFARRVPVVSTTFGCEGIDAVPGEHLLIGDTPDALANACVQLLSDDALRTRVIDAAHALFVSRYRWEDIRPRVAALARAVADGSFTSDPRP